MNDIMLYARLQGLGMSQAKAWNLAGKIRDLYHPIAAVAAAKIHAANNASGGTMGAIPVTNQATKTTSLTMTGASAGATIGTAIFPGVGTAIGAAVGAIVGAIGSLFGPAKEGQAAATWDNMVSEGYLGKQPGRAFDERYYAEAMKGAMDKGNNVWPGCGKNGYKNPDCFYGPMAKVIVQGYLNKTVPLSATTADVYNDVVVPWLKGGAAGLFSWAPFAAENAANGNQQGALVEGAVDRYLGGLPITRADMTEYDDQGYTDHEPALNVALASLLQTTAAPSTSSSVTVANAPSAVVPSAIAAAAAKIAAPAIAAKVVPVQTVATANVSVPAPATPSGYVIFDPTGYNGTPQYIKAADASASPGSAVPVYVNFHGNIQQNGTVTIPGGVEVAEPISVIQPITPQQDTTAAVLSQVLSSETGTNMVSPAAQQLVADVAANGVQQTDLGPPSEFDLSTVPWYVWAGGAGLALYLAMRK